MPFVNEHWLRRDAHKLDTISKRIGEILEYERIRDSGEFEAMPKKGSPPARPREWRSCSATSAVCGLTKRPDRGVRARHQEGEHRCRRGRPARHPRSSPSSTPTSNPASSSARSPATTTPSAPTRCSPRTSPTRWRSGVHRRPSRWAASPVVAAVRGGRGVHAAPPARPRPRNGGRSRPRPSAMPPPGRGEAHRPPRPAAGRGTGPGARPPSPTPSPGRARGRTGRCPARQVQLDRCRCPRCRPGHHCRGGHPETAES